MKTAPVIILVNPQLGENIGAAARAMKNFGLHQLRLVAPRDGWPNARAVDMAAHAADVVEAATIYATTAEAVADLQAVYATTARERDMAKVAYSPRELFEGSGADDSCHAVFMTASGQPEPDLTKARPRHEDGVTSARGLHSFIAVENGKTGILFGAERSGLSNEDVVLADAIISIPVSAEYASLNLAQAVGLVAYEWFLSLESSVQRSAFRSDVASKGELQGLFDQLEGELDARGFWKVEGKKPVMWRNIRNLLQRAQMNAQEVRTMRGIVRCLSEYTRKD